MVTFSDIAHLALAEGSNKKRLASKIARDLASNLDTVELSEALLLHQPQYCQAVLAILESESPIFQAVMSQGALSSEIALVLSQAAVDEGEPCLRAALLAALANTVKKYPIGEAQQIYVMGQIGEIPLIGDSVHDQAIAFLTGLPV